ncbi:drug/metabolite transporter (DMT)-like permease [Pseudochelatococcus lubricantis]|uniref:Drug/metabolite transporter (DMT)-like permease n=1 Tax=Pseudochelatococcus lubricantis TaxID=1538102 RepID=A0ABX0V4S5_9HYPH|nr:DMT family transporter [Pseudochelatococcus lubricantis]NIJ60158.1 drug/metabolite transporter (DMT)-like permease [Pseudochelatococcus lubricantis]
MTLPHSNSRLPLLALIAGGIAIGCSPIFVRVSEIGPISTAFWRLALALGPLVLLFSRNETSANADARPRTIRGHALASAPGVFLAAELAAWHISLHMTSVANSTLLVNMTPVFVALASWLFLRTSISRPVLLGLALCIIGVVILKGGPADIGQGDIRGDAIALFAAMLYAGYILLLGKARKHYSTSVIMLWSTTAAALCILPLAMAVEPSLIPVTLAGWAVLLGLAWISHAGGQSLITYALAYLLATFSSLTLLLQPVVAALLAWLILGESLSSMQITGGLIVIAGIWLARRG